MFSFGILVGEEAVRGDAMRNFNFVVSVIFVQLLSFVVAAQTSSDWPTFGGQPGGQW